MRFERSFGALFITLAIVGLVRAQEWTTQTISEAGFSVSVPGTFEKVSEFNGEYGLLMDSQRRSRFETYYAMNERPAIDARFGVVIIDGDLRRHLIETGTMNDYYNYLGLKFFGDPDSEWYFRDSTPITKNGLTGVDHVYVRERPVSQPFRYTHGRILDDGTKTYLVIYRAQSQYDLQGEEALKFLDSFRLTTTPAPSAPTRPTRRRH